VPEGGWKLVWDAIRDHASQMWVTLAAEADRSIYLVGFHTGDKAPRFDESDEAMQDARRYRAHELEADGNVEARRLRLDLHKDLEAYLRGGVWTMALENEFPTS